MARCQRCGGCRSQWDMNNCPHCNYPENDTRKRKKKVRKGTIADLSFLKNPEIK